MRSPWTWLRGLGTAFRFGVASTGFSVANMLASLVILRWVGADDIGLWHSLLLVQTYAVFLNGGVFNGLGRELPFRLGAGDRVTDELVATAQSVALLVVGVLAVMAVGSLGVSDDPRIRFVLPAVLLSTAANLYQQFLGVTYRADRAFETLARIRWAQAALAIATLPLVWALGYAGLPLRYLLLTVFGVALGHAFRPIRVRPRFHWKHLVTLLKVGIPGFAFAYLIGVSTTFPRVLLLSERSAYEVGLFAPAAAVLALFMMLPAAIGQYLVPQLSHRLGRTGDPSTLWPVVWKASLALLTLSLPLAVFSYFLLPDFVAWLFPKYVESVPAVRWVVVAGIFMGATIGQAALRSAKAWRWLGLFTGVRLASSYLLPLALLHSMENVLEAVALGYAIAQAVSFLTSLVATFIATHSPRYLASTRLELSQDEAPR